MKIISLVSVLVAGIIIIACATVANNVSSNNVPNNPNKWTKKYPQLDKVAASMSNKTVYPIQNSQESLAGTSTNEFGIRDDVLSYIVKTIPQSNESAIFAAIRLIQYENLVLFSDNQESALFFQKKADVAIHCLNNAMDMQTSHDFILTSDQLNTNTPQLKALNERANQLLAWQLIGPNLTFTQMNQMCATGDF